MAAPRSCGIRLAPLDSPLVASPKIDFGRVCRLDESLGVARVISCKTGLPVWDSDGSYFACSTLSAWIRFQNKLHGKDRIEEHHTAACINHNFH